MQSLYSSIPELADGAFASGVIRIPSEQDVPFTPRVRAVVDTPEFHRLQSVTQLALARQVYPGATHTRFEHALGVFGNAIAYLRQLSGDSNFCDVMEPHDLEVMLAAALLHDIGHWPFCHPIEDLGLSELPPHEAYARAFLGPDSRLAAVLDTEWNISPEDVLRVLTGQGQTPAERLSQSILSGPIDIDKMDYLYRDSLHCGVPYGRQFDRKRLIGSLIVNRAGNGLAITSKGRTAAEMMVFARYVMFSEVYWHHTVRSATAMFAHAFYQLVPGMQVDELFRLTEPDLIRHLSELAQGTSASRLLEGVFGAERKLYKRLAEYSIYSNPDLYNAIRGRSAGDLQNLARKIVISLGKAGLGPFDENEIIIDAPPAHREVEFRVDVHDREVNIWRPLREVSPVVDAMSRTHFDDSVKRVRIFGRKEVRQRVAPDAVDAAVRESLSG